MALKNQKMVLRAKGLFGEPRVWFRAEGAFKKTPILPEHSDGRGHSYLRRLEQVTSSS